MNKTVDRHGYIKGQGRGNFFLALAIGVLFLGGVTLRAQDMTYTYTDGTNNTGALSTGDGITLTITSGAATQSGAISGSGAVTVNPVSSDTGTLTLTATNTYTGNTTVDFGTLAVSGTGAAISQTDYVFIGYNSGDNGTLVISNNGTVSDQVSEIGAGSGTTGSVTVTTGGIWTNSGYLYVGDSSTGTLTISNDGQVMDAIGIIGDATGGTGIVTVTGTGSTWTNSSTLIVGANHTGTGTLNIEDDGTVQVGSTGTGTLALAALLGTHGTLNIGNGGLAGTLEAGTVTGGQGTAQVIFDETDASYTFSPVLTGSLSVIQEGTGTTILTGTNTYTGGTTINGGILEVSSQANLGTGGLTLGGGELLTTSNATFTENVTVNAGTNTLAAFTNTTATYSGIISGSNALTIGDTLGNDGTVVLTTNNTYSGGTILDSGILEISSENNLGGVNAGGLTFGGGELLTTSNATFTENVTVNAGTNTLAALAGTAATYTGTFSGPGTLTIGDTTDNGTGTVTLSSSASYFSALTLPGGGITIAGGGTTLALSGYIDQSTTINGAGASVSNLTGGIVPNSASATSSTPLFIVVPGNETATGGVSDPSTTITVNVSNLTVTGGVSQGGTGNGGGAGLGGAVFAGTGAVVTLDNVTLTGNEAIGGDGTGAVGGGGIGGNANNGGGGLFANANVTNSGGANGGSSSNGGTGGFGGGGGSSKSGGSNHDGGFGGGGGGGGGSISTYGGFGGGGGQTGGSTGGFGGGGGNGDGGIGGGNGIIGTISGGGGAGLGGAIFVQNGATVIVTGNSSIYNNTVAGGSGLTNGDDIGGNGAAAGADIFMMSGSSVSLAPGTGNTVTIGDVGDNTNSISDIADDTIYSLPAGQSYTPGNAVTSTNPGGILNIGSSTYQGGTVVLYGNNTYAGGTVISNGVTLEVSQDSNLGAFDPSNALVGNIALSSGGELLTDPSLNGTNTFTTARNVSITDTGTLAAVTDTTATYSGVISDGTDIAAALTIGDTTGTNDGTVILTGSNTYTGLTTIAAGTLAIGGNGGIAASSGVDLTTNATAFDISEATTNQTIAGLNGSFSSSSVALGSNDLTIDTSTTNTFAGVIADGGIGGGTGGSLTLTGTGGLILTGSNSYTGGTTINGGTLEFGSATALGSGPVTLTTGTLEATYGSAVTLNVGGYYTQSGGDLVINVYSGASSDKIEVNGAADITGGELTMNFSGYTTATNNLTYTILTAESITAADFTDATNVDSPGLSPTLKAVSTVDTSDNSIIVDTALLQLPFSTLAGANLTPNQLSVARYIDARDLTITNAGFNKLVGGLNTVDVNPANLGYYLNQLTSLNFANFASSLAFNNASFATAALDGYLANHRGADGTFVSSAGGIDDSGFTVDDPSVDPGLQDVHSRLLAWSPPPSTGLLSDTPAMDLGGADMKNVAETGEAPANLWNVFVSGNVVLAQDFSNSATGTAHADTTTGAVQAGADYKITPHFLVGAEFAYGHTSATLDDLGSSASVDTYSPGLYASYTNHGWYANALGSYGFANYNQQRNVSIGAFGGTATSHPGGDQIVGDLDGGYDFHRGPWTYGPTLGVQYVHLDVDGYTENGLPGDDLTVNQDEADSLRSSLGGHVNYAIKDGGLVFNPHLSASWQHEFLDQSRGITSQFDGIGAGSFVVQTPNPSRESALVDVGLDAQVNDALTVFTDYTVQAGQSDYFGQSVEAGVKIGF